MKVCDSTEFRGLQHSFIGDAEIGGDCTIHSHVWIGDGVKIGDRCKVQAFAYIPPGVVIGDNVFIGPRVTFLNDKYPPAKDFKPLVTRIEEGVSIGGGAVILPGITLSKWCRVGAGAVVTKSVPPGVTVVGNPAKPLQEKNWQEA